MSPIYVPGKLVLRKGWQPMDSDAAAYITAVETADTQPLEEKTKIAIDNFVLGCKADGIWNAIKASCILAGARTLTGALVPLVGTAPTNVGGLFVSGDYNRKTGLVGNGSTKYLDSNRNNNADIRSNKHIAVFRSASETRTANMCALGIAAATGAAQLLASTTLRLFRISSFGIEASISDTTAVNGFWGAAGTSNTSVIGRYNSINNAFTVTDTAQVSGNLQVFARSGADFTDARLAFYSIGESLDLALLDARVTDLINAFAAAIP
jgi:hypothetical protein